MRKPRVAVVGATGMVGQEMIKVLEQRAFPLAELVPLASERSRGRSVVFSDNPVPVRVLDDNSFDGIDIALFSAGGDISERFAKVAVKAGATVIDNSSAFRMEPDVPLVIPEVNPDAISGHNGIISNPNCSTIQMVVVLQPLHERYGLKRVVVSTYQAVSGSGKAAVDELEAQVSELRSGAPVVHKVYPHQIAFNCLPHIDIFMDDGYSREEQKMINETRKIMGLPGLAVTATCVRVPVYYGHSESVNLQFDRPVDPDDARKLLSGAPGIEVIDDPGNNRYPLALECAGKDATYVGRIRTDFSAPNSLNLWIVSDNLRKGAALNAVQVAELLQG